MFGRYVPTGWVRPPPTDSRERDWTEGPECRGVKQEIRVSIRGLPNEGTSPLLMVSDLLDESR